jgi:hypothetical protein
MLVAAILPVSASANWQYSESMDKMDGRVSKFAAVESVDMISMRFPYKNHKPRLTLRTRGGRDLNVMLHFEGQANRDDIYGGKVRIKFDDEKPVTWSYAMPESHGTGLIFLKNERENC